MGSQRRIILSIGTEQGCRVFSKAQKQPQCTCQAWMVVGRSLTPHAALLVRPSGIIDPVVDCHKFTGSKMLPVKADLAIYL